MGSTVGGMSTKQPTAAPPLHPIAEAITARLEAGDPSSVKWLAETANIPRATLTRKLAGAGSFTLPELERIAASFGTRASTLVEDAERITDGVTA